jgi:hypothetical protein
VQPGAESASSSALTPCVDDLALTQRAVVEVLLKKAHDPAGRVPSASRLGQRVRSREKTAAVGCMGQRGPATPERHKT